MGSMVGIKGGSLMKRLLCALIVMLAPSLASAQCGDTCFVGAFGQGGVASDGRAQGFHLDAPSFKYPGAEATVSGTVNSGHNSYSGAVSGSLSGTFHGSGTAFTGRASGVLGDFTGHCDLADPYC